MVTLFCILYVLLICMLPVWLSCITSYYTSNAWYCDSQRPYSGGSVQLLPAGQGLWLQGMYYTALQLYEILMG